MTDKEKKIREAILNGLIDCRDAPDLGWSNFGGIHIDDCITWLEKQGEQAPPQTNERAWLYLVSDVLTWKEGIGQYLDDPRVQALAKRLCSEYTQKLYNPSVLSNSSNTGKNEQKSGDKVKPEWEETDCSYRAKESQYRIKPEPKYRPFKDREECWNEMLKHQPFGWIKNNTGNIFNIIAIINQNHSIKLNECYSKYSDLFKDFKFTDGTPFGIKKDIQ